MSRSLEARRARQLARIEALTDHERGIVVLAGLGNAVVVTVMEAALAVMAVRAVRRGWRHRQLGPARAAAAGLVPDAGWAVGLVGAEVAIQVWARRLVNRRLAAHAASPLPVPPAPS